MPRFGEKLRTLRVRRGMTVRELAAALGYRGHSHISDIEQGKREPRIGFVVKVADLFQVTTDQLLRDQLEVDGDVRSVPAADDQSQQ